MLFRSVFITLPLGVLDIIVTVSSTDTVSFWPGRKSVREAPSAILRVTSDEWKLMGFWATFTLRYAQWIYLLFSVAFFLLFGLTEQRRNWYGALYWKIMGRFGLKRKPRVDPMSDIILDDFRHAASRGIKRTQDSIM